MGTYLDTTRSHTVTLNNPVNGDRSIEFQRNRLITLDDGTVTTLPAADLREVLTADNASTVFPLVNPLDDTLLGAGMTYQELYVAVYSLYRFLETKPA